MVQHSIWILVFIQIITCGYSPADDFDLAVGKLPEKLRVNSYAVVRRDIMVFEIKDISKATLTRKRAVTILNQKYKDMASVALYYSPEMTIPKISGRKLDEYGKEIDKIRNKDIDDYNAFSGSFYDDNRMKVFDLSNAFYPFTYEYEYEYQFSSLMAYPDWEPLDKENLSVEYASFQVILPESMEFRYKAMNLDADPVIKHEEGRKSYTWEVKDLMAFEEEPNMPSPENYMPYIITAPTHFEYEGYEGDLSSWSAYGKWVNGLNQDRDRLPEETKLKIRTLIENQPSEEAKIKVLYEYLQKNTRYVSIQLGIGGYQPMDAAQVDANGYGDCKALVNYMKALLDAAEIDSYYTLVRAGRGIQDIRVDFPSLQFNHVILCVPVRMDTIWLECTSQDCPFGYLGAFTNNRHVLIIRDDESVIAHTPSYEGNLNTQTRKIKVFLDTEGDAHAEIHTLYAGLQFENVSLVLDAAKDDQEKWLYDNIGIPNFELKSFSYSVNNEPLPEAEESLSINLRRYAVTSGKRLFFQPNLMNRQNKLSSLKKERKFDLQLCFAYVDVDSIEYMIPDEFHLEFNPEPVKFETKFGSFECRIMQSENMITYIRKRTAKNGLFPPEEYSQYLDFINRIAEADGIKLVIVKKT